MSEKDKLEMAIDLCGENCNNEQNKFLKIYPFTTENLAGWMPLIDFFDKTFLTVGSSCDQAINATYLGSKKQTIIDINPFVKEYFYLKKAGLIALSINEYLNFFCSFNFGREENKEVFNQAGFQKIEPYLKKMDYNSYLFWKRLFSLYSGSLLKKHLFFSDEERCSPIIQKMNPYLKDISSYVKTREAVQSLDVEFVVADIYQYNNFGNYDNINLSNIGQYASDKEALLHYKEFIKELIVHLNVGGSILLMYFFGTTRDNISTMSNCGCIAPIYNIPNTIELFKEYRTELHQFASVKEFVFGNKNSPDKALILKKK